MCHQRKTKEAEKSTLFKQKKVKCQRGSIRSEMVFNCYFSNQQNIKDVRKFILFRQKNRYYVGKDQLETEQFLIVNH